MYVVKFDVFWYFEMFKIISRWNDLVFFYSMVENDDIINNMLKFILL